MKISIDARGINLYKGSGIGTYTENLLRELLNIDTKNNYSIRKIIQKSFLLQKSMVVFTKIIIIQVI